MEWVFITKASSLALCCGEIVHPPLISYLQIHKGFMMMCVKFAMSILLKAMTIVQKINKNLAIKFAYIIYSLKFALKTFTSNFCLNFFGAIKM